MNTENSDFKEWPHIPQSTKLRLQLISDELGISIPDLILEGIEDIIKKYEMFIEHKLRPTKKDKEFIETILKLVEIHGREKVLETIEYLQKVSSLL